MDTKSSGKVNPLRQSLFWLILLVFLYLFAELVSILALLLLSEFKDLQYTPIRSQSIAEEHEETIGTLVAGDMNYTAYHEILGWSIKSNGNTELYEANSQGIRANREYELDPPPNMVRISTFGDSFTHGDEVRNSETWQEHLANIASNFEVMNFGVGGYGLGQAFLRYQVEGRQYHPDIVFIGFMSENIGRIINAFRPFYIPQTGLPFSKPYFLLQDGELVLKENPIPKLQGYTELIKQPEKILPQLGKYDYHLQNPTKYQDGPLDFLPTVRLLKMSLYHLAPERRRPYMRADGSYKTDTVPFETTLRLFDAFHDSVAKDEAVPIIILFPNRRNLAMYRETGTNVYLPLIQHFQDKGYRYIDLHDAFDEYAPEVPIEKLFVVHHTDAGNKLVARYIADYLDSNRLTELPTRLNNQESQ